MRKITPLRESVPGLPVWDMRPLLTVSISRGIRSLLFYPAKDNQVENECPGGTEDPRIAMTEDGTYVLLYTQWNRKVPRLAVATSKDLKHWTKFGPAFEKAYNGKFKG